MSAPPPGRAAAIVATARTPIGKAYRGALNATHGATLGAHAVAAAVARAGLAPGEVEDVVMGGSLGEGTTGANIARQIAIRAGLPVQVPGMTVNRYCSTGLQTIALAAQRVLAGEIDVAVAGGLESISLVQNEHQNLYMAEDPWLRAHKPETFMPMIDTAEVVAARYGISREAQDAYALQSQRRTAAAQAAGRFDAEIVPIATEKLVHDRESGEARREAVTLSADEGNRPETSAAGLAALLPVREGGCITPGNASQLSDGSAACVVMEAAEAEQRGCSRSASSAASRSAAASPTRWGSAPSSRCRSCSTGSASASTTSISGS